MISYIVAFDAGRGENSANPGDLYHTTVGNFTTRDGSTLDIELATPLYAQRRGLRAAAFAFRSKEWPETPLRLSRLSAGLHNDENYVKRAAIEFPFALAPKPLEWIEAAPGILWLRLPLPFRLDHVNVYLIEDGDGFALIDTGIDNTVSREIWQALFEGPLRDRPLTRILATHCHPDHIGLAGWLCERFGLPLLASQTEYLDALCVRLDPGALNSEPYRSFYHSHGLGESNTELLLSRGLSYLRMVSPLPRTFRRVIAGETLVIGGREFDVITGGGHSAEQVMLHCAGANILLCADQAMAKITPNISVEAIDPDGDPLGIYLRSLEQLRQTMPEDILALPGHNLPFVGLATRIDELVAHHASRCRAILQACAKAPHSVVELVPVVFGRVIEDPHQMSFAFGEALAHANYLVRRNELRVSKTAAGSFLEAVRTAADR